jgi:hypothetical protein
MDTNSICELPKFKNLQAAIDFILKCVDDNDAETLFRACEIRPKELFSLKIFENLKQTKNLRLIASELCC